jgi:hypothetical protein
MAQPSTGRASNPATGALSDEQLLDLVQRQTLKYFWDFAHPVSGMARERSNHAFSYDPEQTIATGGTGFGIMAMIAGAERGLLAREEVRQRLHQICDFLGRAENYHGVFPHFMHGETGEIIPFMPKDDGGDLVETSFLFMGLLAARQYFGREDRPLWRKIESLWRAVEWSHHHRTSDNALMWHSSPNHPWTDRSLPVRGWNECLITYVLAAGSPTYSIDASVYENCWVGGREFLNGRSYFGITLPLGPDWGGPLFLSQYSFLGLDPRGLKDRYTDYWRQNRNHTLINRAYCIDNPHHYRGYGENCWGLSASDSPGGYAAHNPTEDLGVISPTAALSAFPYTPTESMQVLRHLYEDLGESLWGPFGFRDAFDETDGWVAESNLAIDQGPIVVMIENYRSGLLWDLVMSCPEVQSSLLKLGFQSPRFEARAGDASV